jgi:uncharacterized protein (TIGR00369 family)
MSSIPNGFEPILRTSPYLELLGPIYSRRSDKGLILGFFAQGKHCNARGTVHGGVFSSIADVALGYSAALSGSTPLPMVTASLTVDYAGSAKLEDWIEVHTDVQHVGRRMAYANAYFTANEKRIVRASAVFSVSGATTDNTDKISFGGLELPTRIAPRWP